MERLEPRWLLAAVTTDHSDYGFGSTAVIDGIGFRPNEAVQLQVLHTAGSSGSNSDPQNQPWTIHADATGSFQANWLVDDPDAIGASYVLNAAGALSGEHASTHFTDSIAAPVTIATAGNTTASTTLVSSNFSSATAVGSTVIVTIGMDPNAGSVSVADGKGNVYTADADVTNGSGTSGVRTLVFSAPITTALTTSDKITVTFGTSTAAKAVSVRRVAGLLTALAKDVSSTGMGTGTSVTSGFTVTTARPDELLIGAIGSENKSQTITAGTGFTSMTQANTGTAGSASSNIIIDGEYRVVTATNTYAATATIGNVPWAAALVTYKIDVPSVVSINRALTSPSLASSVSWTVTFSKSVTGVDTTDFQLVTTGGVTGAAITGVTGSGLTRTVTASTGTGDGTLALKLVDDDTIVDSSVNPLGGSGISNGGFTGQAYVIDKTAPATGSEAYVVNEDGTLTINAPGVLGNDTDSDTILRTSLITAPTRRLSFTLNSNGSFTYTPTANYNGRDSFVYRAIDTAGNQSANTTVTITITPVNDAPALTGANAFTTVTEDQTTNAGNLVSALISGRTSDVDTGALQGIAITGTANGTGLWQYSTDNGVIWNPVDLVSNASALLLRSTDKVRFVPDGNAATTGSVTYRAWDQTSGLFGTKVDTAINGGTSVFSTATFASSITVSSVNDAPVLVTTSATFSDINEDAASNTGVDLPTFIAGVNITDVDPSAVKGIAVNGVVNTNGAWQFSTNSGSTWTAFGAPSNTAARLLSNVSTNRIRFVPTANYNGTASLTFRAWDVTSGTNGGTASAATNGGTTAFSSVVGTATIAVLPVDDVPAFTKGADQTVLEDSGVRSVANWATGLSAGPANEASQLLSFIVSNSNNSLFSVQPSISATGSLTFTPAANANGTATVTVQIQDNGGFANGGVDTSAAQTFVINITSVNDAPTLNSIANPPAIPEDSGTQTINLAGISAGPNESGQNFTLTATSSNPALIPNPTVNYAFPDSTGTITYAPLANLSGTAVITLTVTDNGGTANGGVNTLVRTFTVNVNSANDTPTVSRNNGSITVNEGTTATNTGTFSDIDSSNVSLSASVGSIIKVGSNSGTWSWSLGTTDGPAESQVVTISANDGDGGISTTSFTLGVNNVAPTVAITGAPSTSPEGTGISLSSNVTDPGSADTFGYAWTVTKNGSPYATGGSPTLNFTPNDNGSYVVTLTATDDDGGIGSDTKTFVVSNVAPTPVIVGAPSTSDEGALISLTINVSDPGSADTFSYAWTVTKDGNPYATSSSSTFNFTPNDNGSYVATLAVTDDDGGVGSDTATIAVGNIAPTVVIVGAPSTSPEGTGILLSSNVTDPGSADTFGYAWTVTKNGNPYATGSTPTFNFIPNDNGSYIVTLAVTDDDGGVGSDTKTVVVSNVAPTPVIVDAPSTSDEGTPISLSSNLTDPGLADTFNYLWTVTKNGNSYAAGTGTTFNFTPDDNGSYIITLVVTDDDGGIGSDTATIAVSNAAPTPMIVGAPSTSDEGSPISLSSSVSDPGSADTFGYAWTVTKNGNPYATGSSSTFDFTPNDNGSYVISLVVTDDDGGVGSNSRTVTVNNVAPTVVMAGAPSTSPEGTSISLSSNVTDPGSADTLSYLWTVTKNGHPYATGSSPTFSFTPDDNGSFIVTLAATDKDGGVGSDSSTIAVSNSAPIAAMIGAPSTSPEGTGITLSSNVTDPGFVDTFSYAWTVTKNGNPYATGTSPTVNFTPDDNGSYVVMLTVTDDDGDVGSDTTAIAVGNISPTVVIAGAPSTSPEGTGISLSSNVTDPGLADTFSYLWTVTKNGNSYATGTGTTFNFTPNDNGSYVVTFAATDKDGGVGSDITTIAVNNVAPTVAIMGAPSISNEGTLISLTSNVTDPGSADTFSYAWRVTKNGNPYATGTSPTFDFMPDDNGSYVVTLAVLDNEGGTGGDAQIIAVNNVAPAALISGAPSAGIEGSAITLSTSVADSGSADTFTYAWTVTKDGGSYATGHGSNLNFVPDDNGVYIATCVITDDDGGAISVSTSGITVINAGPTVNLGDSSAGVRGRYTIIDTTVSDPGSADTESITWDWGDGSPADTLTSGNSASHNREHVYATAGNYSVTVTVLDKDGASAVAQTVVTIAVAATVQDPLDPTKTALIVSGTSDADNISFWRDENGGINYTMNGVDYGPFAPTGHIIAYGDAGRNRIIVDSAITIPAVLYGGSGKDVLIGGGGDDILIGRRGNDRLYGREGRDILLGSLGADKAFGGDGDDILMGGGFAGAEDFNALAAISAEWTRADADFISRLNHLNGSLSGGLNGVTMLDGASGTASEDLTLDILTGQPGRDWFFTDSSIADNDQLIDFMAEEDAVLRIVT